MSGERLLPCPFCGASMEPMPNEPSTYRHAYHRGSKCPALGLYVFVGEHDDPEHIAAWNRRADEALVKALRPFAEAAERYNDIPGILRVDDNVELWQDGKRIDFITVGDLRRARAALRSRQ